MNGDNYVENTAFELALVNAPGSSSRQGAAIDCSPFNNVCFIVQVHTIAGGAVASVSLEESDSKDGPWTAIANSTLNYAANTAYKILEVRNPGKRWMRVIVTKDSANVTEESAMVLRGNSRNYPIAQPADVTLWLNGP